MYKLEMKLISDALPGSGEGLAGFIDTDIVFDENGIPCIPAKRIKGILRESALELLDAGLLNNNIIDIFGKQGQEKGCAFRISNGFLKEYHSYCRLIKYAKYRESNRSSHYFNKESALDYFTYIRSQTKIDCDKGTAKDKSLRINRVLKKGLEFHFELQFDSKHKEDIEKIVKVTRFFGHNRTRGLGLIEMKLNRFDDSGDNKPHQTTPTENTGSSNFKDDTLCCIPYKLENIDHLMISTSISDRNTSLNYISGSCILGALAYKYLDYLKSQSVKDPGNDSRFRNIFISGVVSFSPAYVADDYFNVYFPAPLAVVKQKNRNKYYNCADEEQWEKFLKLEGKTESLRGFISIYSDTPQKNNVKTEVLYHHSRPEDKSIGHAKGEESGVGGEFFQLEAIAPGQTFAGEIMGSYKYLKELYKVIEPEMEMYLGKSKTAQYGKVKLLFERIFDVNEEAYTWKKDEETAITLLSDMITVNSNGFAAPDIKLFVDEFAKQLGVASDKIEISERCFLNCSNMGGYMGVWNLHKPQYPAISAGSTVVLINGTGKDISEEKMQKALQHHYGIKNEEGYGMIDILPFFPITTDDKNNSCKELEDVSKIQPFVYYTLEKAIKNSLKNQAIKKAKVKEITSSFLGRLKLIIWNSSTPQDLCEKLSQLKKRAEENLKKLKADLFLNADDHNNKKSITINFASFSKDVKESWCSEILINHNEIIEQSCLTQNNFFTPEALFNLYKSYALDYITFLQLKNRGK